MALIAQQVGPLLIEGDDGSLTQLEVEALRGERGERGETGATGLTGPRGETGATGAAGRDGADGAPGGEGPPGSDGAPGTDGTDGRDGLGVPAGGTTGQLLAKTSNFDNDTRWSDPSTIALTDGSVESRHILDGTIVASDLAGALRPSRSAISSDEALRALGTNPGQAAAANDARLSDERTPTDGSVTAAKVAASLKPSGSAVATDEALRRLGTAAGEAAAADDARLSDSRAPRGVAAGDLSGTYPNPSIAAGVIVNADINSAAAIALTKLAVDPLTRANHTGTQPSSTIDDFDAQVRRSRLDQMTAPTAAVAMNAQRVTGVANPSAAQDAATAATAMGAINHGATASTARPAGYAVVTWIGSVEPTNRLTGDVWIRTV